jgi:hypothetical protein
MFPQLPDDQVVRLRMFRAEHPDIEITEPAQPNGLWAARRAGLVLCCEHELSDLLDRLEWLLDAEGKYLP